MKSYRRFVVRMFAPNSNETIAVGRVNWEGKSFINFHEGDVRTYYISERDIAFFEDILALTDHIVPNLDLVEVRSRSFTIVAELKSL